MDYDTASYLQILTRCCPMCGGHTREVDRSARRIRLLFVKTRYCPSCGIRFQLDPFSTVMRLFRRKRVRQPYIAVEPEYPVGDSDLHMAFVPSRMPHATVQNIPLPDTGSNGSRRFDLRLGVHNRTIEMHVHLDTQPIIESAQYVFQIARELTLKSIDKAVQFANERQAANAQAREHNAPLDQTSSQRDHHCLTPCPHSHSCSETRFTPPDADSTQKAAE